MTRSVLIVDDEPDVSRLLAFSLKAAGFETHEAISGKAALEVTARIKPDVVILDLMLPDVTGYEVCRRLRADPLLGESGSSSSPRAARRSIESPDSRSAPTTTW